MENKLSWGHRPIYFATLLVAICYLHVHVSSEFRFVPITILYKQVSSNSILYKPVSLFQLSTSSGPLHKAGSQTQTDDINGCCQVDEHTLKIDRNKSKLAQSTLPSYFKLIQYKVYKATQRTFNPNLFLGQNINSLTASWVHSTYQIRLKQFCSKTTHVSSSFTHFQQFDNKLHTVL